MLPGYINEKINPNWRRYTVTGADMQGGKGMLAYLCPPILL
jgi:hypothetical protein